MTEPIQKQEPFVQVRYMDIRKWGETHELPLEFLLYHAIREFELADSAPHICYGLLDIGFCKASTGYFANAFGVDRRVISATLSRMSHDYGLCACVKLKYDGYSRPVKTWCSDYSLSRLANAEISRREQMENGRGTTKIDDDTLRKIIDTLEICDRKMGKN